MRRTFLTITFIVGTCAGLSCSLTVKSARSPAQTTAEISEVLNNDSTDQFDFIKRQFVQLTDHLKSVAPQTEVGQLPMPTVLDPSLQIDYTYLPPSEKTQNLVILLSGVHGVEAPTGALLQHLFLSQCTSNGALGYNKKNTGVLIIHVMNPYGMKYGRRFNSNNVDLNRNCFESSADPFPGTSIKNPEYEELRPHLEDKGRYFSWLQLAPLVIKHGTSKIEKALSGQYTNERGLYFGGKKVEDECRSTQELISKYASAFTNIAFIDVHTGLGEKGINQIMTNVMTSTDTNMKDAYTREINMLNKMFPAEDCEDLCQVQIGVPQTDPNAGKPGYHTFLTTGDSTQWIHEKFLQKRLSGTVISVTSEIGSTSNKYALLALINESFCHRNPSKCDKKTLHADRRYLRDQFTAQEHKWQRKVVAAAEQMCRAIGRFSNTE